MGENVSKLLKRQIFANKTFANYKKRPFVGMAVCSYRG